MLKLWHSRNAGRATPAMLQNRLKVLLIEHDPGANTHASTLNIYNNSLGALGTNAMSAGMLMRNIGSGSSITIKNNIVSAPTFCVSLEDAASVSATTSDYNAFNCSSGSLYANGFQTYAQWRALGFDTHGVLGSDPSWVGAPGNENLNAGSSAINAGVNLSSLGIPALNSDKVGTPRPSTGAWDIGAFKK